MGGKFEFPNSIPRRNTRKKKCIEEWTLTLSNFQHSILQCFCREKLGCSHATPLSARSANSLISNHSQPLNHYFHITPSIPITLKKLQAPGTLPDSTLKTSSIKVLTHLPSRSLSQSHHDVEVFKSFSRVSHPQRPKAPGHTSQIDNIGQQEAQFPLLCKWEIRGLVQLGSNGNNLFYVFEHS